MHVDAQSKIQIALLLTKIRLGKIKSRGNLVALLIALLPFLNKFVPEIHFQEPIG